MSHTYANLVSHLIFSTKERRPFLEVEARPRVFGYVGGVARELGCNAIIVNGTSDHVHVLVEIPPRVAISDVVRVLKTNSSRWIHRQFPGQKAFAWQSGFGAFSVSRSQIDRVVTYIENQEQHHGTLSFQDEFRTILLRHGLSMDEEHGWG